MITKASKDLEQMMAELIEAWNGCDVDKIANLYSPFYSGVDIAGVVQQQGRESIRKTVKRFIKAFPNLHLATERLIIQGNNIVLLWRATGTHCGTFFNIPASGRLVNLRGVSIFIVKDGFIHSGDCVWDFAGFLRNIGLLPELRDD